MAKLITSSALKELDMKLSRLGAASARVAERAVYAGAEVMADEVRHRLEKNLEGSETTTGDLLDSFGVAPIKMDEKGVVNTKLGFSGYDRKGVPNQLKARAMESGTSRQRKKPFLRPAISAKKKEAVQVMERAADEEIKKIIN